MSEFDLEMEAKCLAAGKMLLDLADSWFGKKPELTPGESPGFFYSDMLNRITRQAIPELDGLREYLDKRWEVARAMRKLILLNREKNQ